MYTHGDSREAVEIDGIRSVLSSRLRLRHKGSWTAGQWHCDFSSLGTGPRLLRDIQQQSRGHSGLRWFPMARATGCGVLREDGTELQHRDIKLIAAWYSSLADIVTLTWLVSRRLCFQYISVAYPMTTRAADQFRDLCATLVANYPRLLWRPAEPRGDTIQSLRTRLDATDRRRHFLVV